MSEVLLKIGGVPVYVDEDEHLSWTGEFTVDGDGSPRCYGPEGTQPLDYLGNAGYPGNWWGVATHNQQSSGYPIVQGGQNPCPGYYVSTTAYVVAGYYYSDPRHYLDSEKVLFAVIPGNVRKAVAGICKGCKAKVTDKKTEKSVECVIGDIGPTDHMGEGSMALAEFFGLDSSPKHGGSSDTKRFLYECWPGVAAKGYVLQ
jgi:Fungal chitosanase of glycosyl hydrolase group 75